MISRNENLAKLRSGYLFPEINRRKKEFLARNPSAKLISLGIGDTTEVLTPHILQGLHDGAKRLGSAETYSGYGAEQGIQELREKIAAKLYAGKVQADDVFVSDGAKPDTGRLQILFGSGRKIAVQNPAYPVYVDSSVMFGNTLHYNEITGQFDGLTYLECTPRNDFFPDLTPARNADLIFFCSPNNPTGAVATKEQLKQLVDFARDEKKIIIFDAAYSQFIRDTHLPRSIFEIPHAEEVALEVNSFSKPIGFTGVRVGWVIVPEALQFADGFPVKKDWNRIVTTLFNGASNVAQHGALAALDDEGMKEMQQTVSYYMDNAAIIRDALHSLKYEVYGGINAPYVWVHVKKDSWQAFNELLEKAHIVTTPGVGFGSAGQNFLRFSAFGHRKDIEEAVERLRKL